MSSKWVNFFLHIHMHFSPLEIFACAVVNGILVTPQLQVRLTVVAAILKELVCRLQLNQLIRLQH